MSVECRCGGTVHDGICYECGAEVRESISYDMAEFSPEELGLEPLTEEELAAREAALTPEERSAAEEFIALLSGERPLGPVVGPGGEPAAYQAARGAATEADAEEDDEGGLIF